MRTARGLCVAIFFSLSIAAAQPRILGVVNGASFQQLVAPGSFATAAVQDLAVAPAAANSAFLPYSLAGVSATVNNQAAALYYVSATQINFQVPRNTAPGLASLVIRFNGVNSVPFQFTVGVTAPGLLLYGSNQVVAQHPDGQLITQDNPIATGDVAVIYLTGIGPVDNPANDAVPTPYPPLATATSSSSITIGGAPAQILFLGLTPGFASLAQANVLIPDLPPGDYPVVLTVGGNTSSANGPVLSVTRGPHLTLTSGSLAIDPENTDSYSFQGDFRGLSLDNVQTIAFAVGQFTAKIPFDQFTRQQGSNILTYQDKTGLNPYWLSNLTINPDARTFTASANGIALSGLPNPFPLRFGANDSAGCTMARMQRTGSNTWGLTREAAPETPCLITDAYMDPVMAGGATNVTFQTQIQPTLGLDANSIRLYRADENAQPAGAPLCTLAAQPGGIYSCSLVINEPQATTVPLLVQATAGTRTLLSTGFALQVAREATPSDDQQLSTLETSLAESTDFFAQFGETPHARSLAIAALRKLFPGRSPLTGSPIALALDGVSIDARIDSGVSITLLRNRIETLSPSAASFAPAALAAKAPLREADQPSLSELIFRNADPKTIQCGEFKRDLPKNQKVVFWTTDALFFRVSNPERVYKHLADSRCPKFEIDTIPAAQALPESLDRLADYGTVIISSHGNEGKGRGALVTASTDKELVRKFPTQYALVQVEYNDGILSFIPFLPRKMGTFISVLPGNPHLRKLNNAVVFGAFCFSDLLARTFIGGGSGSAYYGYPKETTPGQIFGDTDSVFDALVNRYENTGNTTGSFIRKGSDNLAYTGNPKLTVPKFGDAASYPITSGQTLTLKAELEGAEKCDGVMQLHWKKTGQAGTLRPAKNGFGENDYTAADVEAIFTPTTAQGTDNVVVDFQPNGAPGFFGDGVASRACTNLTGGRREVIVDTTGVFNYSDEGPHALSTPNVKVTTGSPFEVSDSSLGGTNKLRVEQTGNTTWKVTQDFASPSRDDVFTQTWNRVDLRLVNSPGPLQVKVHVDVNVTGTCQAYEATFVGNAGVSTQLDDGGPNGCKDSWDFNGATPAGSNGSALLVLKLSALGAKGGGAGPGKGNITATIELLDTPPGQ